MLGRSHIAQKCRTAHGSHGTADGSSDVVIARGNICYQRSKHIERRSLADGLLHLHVGSNLIHRHMARPLYHHLHILCPGTLGQLPQAHQLLNLAHIGSIRQAARTAGIAERYGHIVLTADIKNLIIIFIERIFVAGHRHPGKNQRAAPGDDVHLPLVLLDLLNSLSGNAAVEGNEIHAVLGMEAHHINEILCSQGIQIPLIVNNAVIHRHRANHGRTLPGELLAERLGVAVAGQIHNRLCPQVNGRHNLLHFHVIILAVPGNPQVHIDFRPQHRAHALRLQALVVYVGRNRHLAACHQGHQLLHGHALLGCHLLYLRRDNPLAGRLHLSLVLSCHHSTSFPYYTILPAPLFGRNAIIQCHSSGIISSASMPFSRKQKMVCCSSPSQAAGIPPQCITFPTLALPTSGSRSRC